MRIIIIGATTAGIGLAEYLDGLVNTWLEDGTIDQMISDNGVAASFEE